MKLTLDTLLKAVLVFTLLFMWGYKYAHSSELVIPAELWHLKDKCEAKADATLFAYQNRKGLTEYQTLLFLDASWKKTWEGNPNLTYASYVDMKRIIRDAYRKDKKGIYEIECCDKQQEVEYTITEFTKCLEYQF